MALALDSAVDRNRSHSSRALGSKTPKAILEAWHLFSLDAPTVAILWSSFFASAMRIKLPWHAPLLLGLGTWLIYVADRLLDGLRPRAGMQLRRRHLFHARHARAFLIASVIAAGILVWLIASRMIPSARHEDMVLFACAVLYFLAVHASSAGRWLPKEMAVGVIFAAACAVPAWSRMPSGHAMLLPDVALFAALCWLNCVAIERWESQSCADGGTLEHSHATTRWAVKHFRTTALILSCIAATIAVFQAYYLLDWRTAAISLAGMAAILLLALIDRSGPNFSATALRIAADLALLTPLLVLPVLR